MKTRLVKLLAMLMVIMMVLSGCAEATQSPDVQGVAAGEGNEAVPSVTPNGETPAAEDTAEDNTAEATQAPAEDDTEMEMALTVNGDGISAALVMQYAEYQVANGVTETADYEQAIQDLIVNQIANQKIRELGFDQFTQEEKDAFMLDAQAEWQTGIDEYVSYFLTEDTEEARAQAAQDAEAFYAAYGLSVEVLYDNMLVSEGYNRLQEYMLATQEVTVTDEEIQETFLQYAKMDEEQFAGNVAAYELYKQYYGYQSLYTPEGYRGVTHILLQVDQDLLANYMDLSAQLEEEGTTVTQEDADAALAAVLASRQEDIDTIYSRLESGESFETLIAEFGTDPGMTDPTYLAEGYDVHKDSVTYDTVFTNAAFSEKMQQVGDVSDPVVGTYGIHILYYLRDIPAGYAELTDEMKEMFREYLLGEKQNEVINGLMQSWLDEAVVVRNEEVIASLGAQSSAEAE